MIFTGGMNQMLNADFDKKFIKEGLTFDDVLLIPGESNVEPRNVSAPG